MIIFATLFLAQVIMRYRLFQVTGDKAKSIFTDDDALKFLSKKVHSLDEFDEEWKKKLSLATKFEIKYAIIKLIKKEDNDDSVLLKYKGWSGLPSEYEFAFENTADYDDFCLFLEKHQYFVRRRETLAPFKAVFRYLLVFLFTLSSTIFSHFQAIAAGNNVEKSGATNHGFITISLGGLALKAFGWWGALL